MIGQILRVIDNCNIVFGFLLNLQLLFLIIRCSKPNLGNYRNLLILFACNDVFMISLHAIVKPATVTSGSALGIFSQVFPGNKYIISVSGACFAIPMTLMDINFLHRYWAVWSPLKIQLFSKPNFILQLATFAVFIWLFWFCSSLAIAGNTAGNALLEQSISDLDGIHVDDGWLVLHFWDESGLNIRNLIILLCVSSLTIGSIIVAGILCFLTLHHLKHAKTYSSSYKLLQFKILRALFAQSAIPVIFVYIPYGVGLSLPLYFQSEPAARLDRWFTTISSFPAFDAIVIISLMKDYREGLRAIFCKKYRSESSVSKWTTTQTAGIT